MKRLSVVLMALSLAACGGGGGSSPIPTPTIRPANKVGFTITQLGSGPVSGIRRQVTTAACSGNPSSVALEAIPPTQPSGNWELFTQGYEVEAVEYDTNCNPVTSSPAYATVDSSIASTSIPGWFLTGYVTPTTPPTGSTYIAGLTPGTTSLTATFADNTSSSVPLYVYGTFGVTCDTQFVYDGTPSDLQNSGQAWSASEGTSLDPYNGNYCGGGSTNPADPAVDVEEIPGGIEFPYGYDIVASGNTSAEGPSQLAGVTNCSAFASQGTTLASSAISSPTIQLLLFRTSTGACVKFAPFTQVIGTNGPDLVGFYAVSDGSGNFSY